MLIFTREAMAKFENLRSVILEKLLESFSAIRSAKIIKVTTSHSLCNKLSWQCFRLTREGLRFLYWFDFWLKQNFL